MLTGVGKLYRYAFLTKLKLFLRFSRQLHPIFDAASDALKDEDQIVFGRVDCDQQGDICKEFSVNKVKTIIIFLSILNRRLVSDYSIVPTWQSSKKRIPR